METIFHGKHFNVDIGFSSAAKRRMLGGKISRFSFFSLFKARLAENQESHHDSRKSGLKQKTRV